MKNSKGTMIAQIILLLLLSFKSFRQLSSAFSRLDTPEGIATLIGSSLYIIAIVGIIMKKRWAAILVSIVLFVEIISTMLNPSIDLGERIIASIINIILISLSYFLYKKFISLPKTNM